MAIFAHKLENPEETYTKLLSKDKTASAAAKTELVTNLNLELVGFLCEKYKSETKLENKLTLLEVFYDLPRRLTEEELTLILKTADYKETLVREAVKTILKGLNEDNFKAAIEVLSSTTMAEVHKTLQFGIENSGVLDKILEQWNSFSLKDQTLYIEELVLIQSPKTYPIFLEIMKQAGVEDEDKKFLQVEFTKHLPKIKNPDFMELCIDELPSIASSIRYPLFKSLQMHGKLFYEKFFGGLSKKDEPLRIQSLKLMVQLADPDSYEYLFPFLRDLSSQVATQAMEAVTTIVKAFCDGLDEMNEEELKNEKVVNDIHRFTAPLVECLGESYVNVIKNVTACLLRLGRYDKSIILANLPAMYKYSADYFKNYLRGLTVEARKSLLINACKFKNIETGKTAIQIMSDPSEGYIVETLNSLLVKHFLSIPPEIQTRLITLMNEPRLQDHVAKILNHKDPAFRLNIIRILGDSGAPNVLTMLEGNLRDSDDKVREEILNILDMPAYKGDKALDMMIVLLSDVNVDIVLNTINKLREHDEPRVMIALSKLLTSEEISLRVAAYKAMAYITKRRFLNGFRDMSDEARLSVGTSLVKMDPSFLPETSKNLSSTDPTVRLLSAQILEVLYLNITPELKTNLIVAIQDPDPKVRSVVVMILGRIGGVAVSDMLVSCLSDRDDRVRANAVEALLNTADITYADKIVPCLYDSSNRVRGNAIMTLWKLGYYKVYNAIVEMFKSDDKWMRASVAFAIGELKDIRFFPVLINNLKDQDPDVRRNVVKALSKIANPYVLAPYIRPMRFDPDEKVRKEVMSALTLKRPSPAAPVQ